jgi:hypothetical protein
MKHQIKRFNQFVNEYYSHSDFFGKEEGTGNTSSCCGSVIDDQGCCTECGEECETAEDMPARHSKPHAAHSWMSEPGQHGEWRIEEGKRKPKAEEMEMEDDEMPMAKKPAGKAPAKKPMPFMPKKPAGKAPMIQPKKPGAAGVEFIKGAAKANAMKKAMPGNMPGKKG